MRFSVHTTVGQSLEAQIQQLTDHGCERIFQEKISGAKAERPQLTKLLESLRPGDTLVVTRLDRLARSTLDLLNVVKATAAKEANFLSLAEPWANTNTPVGKLMLTVLGGLAEFEKELIALRTSDGRERAKKAGVKFGPKPKLSSHQIDEVRQRKERGESCRFLARSYGVSPNTISRIKAQSASPF
jgi:DNA invertase Pin-like site-specific DNA recombinase